MLKSNQTLLIAVALVTFGADMYVRGGLRGVLCLIRGAGRFSAEDSVLGLERRCICSLSIIL